MDALEAILDLSSSQHVLSKDVADIKQICKIIETSERKEILNFFGTFDPISNHEMSLQLYQSGTGLWLTEGVEFKVWTQEKNAKLWLYGIPGAGKTILAANTIRKVLTAANADGDTGAAYYYCDYKKETSRELVSILASIAGQLARQSELCFKMLEKTYKSNPGGVPRHTLPSAEQLQNLIVNMCNCFQCVAVIVDAIDECSAPGDVASGLMDLVSFDDSNIKIILFSRNVSDIRQHLNSCKHVSIAAHRSDLELYVNAQFVERAKKRRGRDLSATIKAEISDRLVNHADGMFRWVVCQLDHLYELPSDTACRTALKELPPDLNTTYARILERVEAKPKATSTMVRRVLWWLMDDSNPALKADALCQAVAIEDGDTIMDESAVPDVDAILAFCSSFVRLSVNEAYIELAHFTVKEYLRGLLLEHGRSDDVLAYKTRTALTYLCMVDFDEPVIDWQSYLNRLKRYPFYSVSVYWRRFLGNFTWTSYDCVNLIQQLFSPSGSSNYASWAQTFMLEEIDARGTKRTRYDDDEGDDLDRMDSLVVLASVLADSSQLHFASILGVYELVKWLIDIGCDVNEGCGIGAPLVCAMLQSRVLHHFLVNGELEDWLYDRHQSILRSNDEVVEALLKHGANKNHELRGPSSESRSVFRLACSLGYGELLLDYDLKVDRATLEWFWKGRCGQYDEEDLVSVISNIQASNIREADQDLFIELTLRYGRITEDLVATIVPAADDNGLSHTVGLVLRDACETDNVSVVKALHATYGQALVSYRDPASASTPLLIAAASTAKYVLAYLLDIGSNVDERCCNGDTVLHKCIIDHWHNLDEKLELLEFLLSNDVDISATNEQGDAPIHMCARDGSAELLEVLLSNSADALQANNDGSTAWHIIVARDDVEAYRTLCSHAPTDQREIAHGMKDQSGKVLAHIAALAGPSIFAEMLAEYICNCPTSHDGRNIVHFAAEGAHRTLTSLRRLLELGTIDVARSDNGTV